MLHLWQVLAPMNVREYSCLWGWTYLPFLTNMLSFVLRIVVLWTARIDWLINQYAFKLCGDPSKLPSPIVPAPTTPICFKLSTISQRYSLHLTAVEQNVYKSVQAGICLLPSLIQRNLQVFINIESKNFSNQIGYIWKILCLVESSIKPGG